MPEISPVNSGKPSYRFGKDKRLRRKQDFDTVFAAGIRVSNEWFTICCRPNEGLSRLGLSVSKKVGFAVIRNRWKRLFRNIFRLDYANLPKGYDFVVIPKRVDPVPSYAQLHSEFRRLVFLVVKKSKSTGSASRKPK